MGFSLGALIVDLEARTGKFETDLGRAASIMKKRAAEIDRTLNKAAKNIAKYGAAAAAGLAVLIIKNTKEAELALAQLDAAVKSTGGAAGFTTPQLVAMSEALQKTTTFADDAIQAMQSVLLTFTRINGPEFKGAQQAVLDISTRLGTDLKASAILVGKALNDPVKGMAALGRAGIQFTDEQKKTIKTMSDLGRLSEAQGVILSELQTQFGGAAAAARDTFGGALVSLKNAFGDLFEASTEGTSAAKESVEGLTKALQDPSVIHGVQSLTAEILKLIGKIGEAIAGLTILFSSKGGNADVNLDIQIDQTKQKLNQLTAALGETREEQDRTLRQIFGPKFAEHPLTKQIRDLREEYDTLIARQRVSLGLITPRSNQTGGGRNRSETQQNAAALQPVLAATEEFEKQSAALSKQIALYGQTGTAAQIRYQIESGALENMHPSEQQHLLALAQQYDWLVKQAKAVEDLEKEYEQLGNTTLANRMAIDASRLAQPLVQGDVGGAELPGFDNLNNAVQDVGKRTIEMGEVFEVTVDEMSVFAEEAARNIQSSLADFLFDPFKDGLKGMLKGLIDTLRRMVAEIAASQILKSLGGTSGVGSFLGGLFGGTRAKGGFVVPGKHYLVGERGPEMFSPATSGMVTPNNKLGGVVYAPHYTFNIDSRTDRAQVRQETYAIASEVTRRGFEQFRDHIGRGGR